MTGDLVAHDVGLFEYLQSKRVAAAGRGFIYHHRQRRLERMGEITDVSTRAFDDFLVGVDQRIGLARKRRDLFREFASQPLGTAGADGGEAVADALERGKA